MPNTEKEIPVNWGYLFGAGEETLYSRRLKPRELARLFFLLKRSGVGSTMHQIKNRHEVGVLFGATYPTYFKLLIVQELTLSS